MGLNGLTLGQGAGKTGFGSASQGVREVYCCGGEQQRKGQDSEEGG